jgi:glycosyltransferase involved in cell wall biosynthesis
LRLYRGQANCCYTIHSPFVDELKITWRAQGLRGRIKSSLGLPIIRALEAECLTGSDVLIAKSDFTRGLITQHYGDSIAARVMIIPGWTDTSRFQPAPDESTREEFRSQLGWPIDEPVFFVLRRLEARMGLDNLLRALDLVRRRGYRVHTYIGGSGSELHRLVKLRSALALEDEVTFLGFVSRETLPLAYAACDASIIPTAQLECFGIIALEALASGRPALVTPVGALPEVIGEFEPRWIARDSTPSGCATLIGDFLDRKLPDHGAPELRARLEQRFSFDRGLAAYTRALTPDVVP